MANEYLKRTPTSTGNRKVWTFSCWVKISGITSAILTPFGAYRTGTSNGDNIFFRSGTGGAIRFSSINSTTGSGYVGDIVDKAYKRDNASWIHVLAVANTTAGGTTDRWHLYVNGSRITDTDNNTYPTDNYETNINNLVQHYVGAADGGDQGQLFDAFFVDGQALTPDVFGFYKDGNGYISAGSTQSTDFRPGQWVPKKPSVIKNTINNNGGFGVNGFYLPMNDSSNFGADFHCDPNSIITLKGEDLPQPRNGAPDTTDAYVSQLRTDPYAANLVLAVPGITGAPGVAYTDFSANIKGSGTNKVLTANGNAGVAVTASYYGSALSFDGSGDYLSVADNSDFGFGTGDFTIEYWIYHNGSSSSAHTFDLRPSGNEDSVTAFYALSSELRIYLNAADKITIAGELVGNQWTHHAIERHGSTLTFYQNGVARGVNTSSGDTLRSSAPAVIGAKRDFSASLNGYIQDLRVYKGVAKYKGGFDVPKPYTPVGIGTWRAVSDTTANNFTTMSPLVEARPSSGSNTNHASSIITFADGNLSLTNASSGGNAQKMIAFSSVGFSTGKWYYEEITGSNGRLCLTKGIQQLQYGSVAGAGTGVEAFVTINAFDGSISVGNTAYYSTATPANLTAESFDTTNVMGVTIDASLGKNNLTVQFYKDGVGIATLTGIGATSPVEEWFPTKLPRASGSADEAYFNFGQNPTFSGRVTAGTYTDDNGKGLFKYQPPTGFLALCEDNLPTPAIADPGKYFKTVLYTGDDANGRSITGVGFQPDFVWIKPRTTTGWHHLFDSVRGAKNRLFTNDTGAETSTNSLISFDYDGFSLGTENINDPTQNNVAWCWKAGGATVSNTDGSITSQVSANQDAGFSIVSWTSDGTSLTVGHGLNKVPAFILQKQRDASSNWSVYHKDLAANETLQLDTTVAKAANSDFANTRPTSSVLSSFTTGVSGRRVIAYCWAEIEGFSKFGSYVGNGNADGPFIYTGGKPAFLMIKRTDGTGNWVMHDNARNSTNPAKGYLVANSSGVEQAGNDILDFLSNGFKIRNSWTDINASGGSYVFAAFAESPFKTANSK